MPRYEALYDVNIELLFVGVKLVKENFYVLKLCNKLKTR